MIHNWPRWSTRRCRHCRFPLYGSKWTRCPTCGRPFAPNDRRSYLTRKDSLRWEPKSWAMFLGMFSAPVSLLVVRSTLGFYLFVGSCSLGVWLLTTTLLLNRRTRRWCMRLRIA